MKLSKSQAHYIKAVYELSFDCDDGVRVCDVAEKLNVSKASASFAITNLSKLGLVYKDADRRAHLTTDGERQAVLMLDKFEIIEAFLIKILCVNKIVADHDACAIGHVISTDTLCAICRFSNRVKCPDSCSLSCNADS